MAKVTRTMCLQLSVDARHWDDDHLIGLEIDGMEATPSEARRILTEMAETGFEVLPCKHRVNHKGYCTGIDQP